jgi:hypothetical protein
MPTLFILCYNGTLVTWTVVCLTAAKFKPLTFSVSGFALSYTANIVILITLCDLCLLPTQFCHKSYTMMWILIKQWLEAATRIKLARIWGRLSVYEKSICQNLLSNSIKQSPSWESNSRLAGKQIEWFFGTQHFNIVFIRDYKACWILSCATQIQFTYSILLN